MEGGIAQYGVWHSSVWGVVQLSMGCGVAQYGVCHSSVWGVAQLSMGCGVAQYGVCHSSVWGVAQISMECGVAQYEVCHSSVWGVAQLSGVVVLPVVSAPACRTVDPRWNLSRQPNLAEQFSDEGNERSIVQQRTPSTPTESLKCSKITPKNI
jgi:hypothetical protein